MLLGGRSNTESEPWPSSILSRHVNYSAGSAPAPTRTNCRACNAGNCSDIAQRAAPIPARLRFSRLITIGNVPSL